MKILLFLILYIPQLLFAATFYQSPYGFTNNPISEYTANGHTLESYSQWYASLYCPDSSNTCTIVYLNAQTTSPYYATMRFCKTSTQYETLLGYDGTNCIVSNTDFCPTGTHAEFTPPLPASGPSTRSCVPDQPECPEPPLHPCDTRDPLKAYYCKLTVTWDEDQCFWKSNNCGWEEMSPFAGYYTPNEMTPELGGQVCWFGCEFWVDEVLTDEMTQQSLVHVSAKGQYCIPTVNDPSTEDIPPEDKTVDTEDGDSWEPDNNSETYCGEFNGTEICVNTVPEGTCVARADGSVICRGTPEPEPNTVNPVEPDISTEMGGGTGRVYFYSQDTIFGSPPGGGGGLIQCPTGTEYKEGVCQQPAGEGGTCPPGFTLQGGVCVYTDLGQFGTFAGPPVTVGPTEFPPVPEFSYYDSLSSMMGTISASPLLSISPQCSSSSSSCPSFEIMGQSTTIHCDLAQNAIPLLNAFLWLSAGLISLRAVLSA